MSVRRPINETETVLNFVSKTDLHGFEIVKFFGTFPDAIVRDTAEDILYYVEFEYKLSSFIAHGHDVEKCNFIICYTNNIPRKRFPLTVWEVEKNLYPSIETPNEEEIIKFKKSLVKKPTIKMTAREIKEHEEQMREFLETIRRV